MTQTALALMMLVVAGRGVEAADVPRANLDSAPPPVAAMINEAALTVEASPSSAEAWGDYAIVLHVHAYKPEADIAYAEAQRLAPSEFRWAYFRGVLQMKLDPSKALELFYVAIELDGAYGPAYIWRGLALEMVGRDDDARRDYLQAIRLQPSNASAHLHLGQLELKQGKIDDAIGHLEKARVARPDDSAILSSLARAYTRTGDRTRARELADAARKTNASARRVVPDHRFNEVAGRAVTMQAIIARAKVYFKAGRSDRAVAELQVALSHYPDAGQVHESLARVYLSRREYQECVRSSRIALASGLTSASVRTILGAGLMHLGQLDEAEEAIRLALDEAPTNLAALRLYGIIATARGDDVKAIERFTEALDIADDASFHRLRAAARSRLARHDEAIAELQAVLATAQEDSQAWLALGEAHQRAGDPDAAVIAYDRAAAIAPSLRAGRLAALILIEQRQFVAAAKRLRDLRKRWPRNPDLMNDLAWLLATCPDDDVRRGREALLLIVALVGETERQEPAFLDTLAAALAETGRFTDAVSAMEEALALLPGDAPAERRAAFEARRDRYAQGRPWRDGS